jgi:hypothetical protein
MAASSKL